MSHCSFLYNTGAVIVISVYTSLPPFAILPLYAVIENLIFFNEVKVQEI